MYLRYQYSKCVVLAAKDEGRDLEIETGIDAEIDLGVEIGTEEIIGSVAGIEIEVAVNGVWIGVATIQNSLEEIVITEISVR
ncbi:hypothetical protein EB796_021156 [Bugula neritina]|uniref:Uncharacterized protein n=1 Tax=Bugula neritina TaxID=10212 RepID=A0A7J7J2X4_BUGNE|nr:hypothetical protein EB796_021156 [Bugula neritina]